MPVTDSLIGQTISHYRIVDKLGDEGMSVLYKSEGHALGPRRRIEIPPARPGASPSALERFRREARSAPALYYPNIRTIYVVSEHEGQSFINSRSEP